MASAWNFLDFRSLKGRLRRVKNLSLQVEKAMPRFAAAENALERTKTEGDEKFGNSEFAAAAMTEMLKHINAIYTAGCAAGEGELIVMHRVYKVVVVNHQKSIVRTFSHVPIRGFQVQRALDVFRDAFEKFEQAIQSNRNDIQMVRQGNETGRRFFSTTTDRRSAIAVMKAAFDSREAVGKLQSVGKEIEALCAAYKAQRGKPEGNSLIERLAYAIRQAADALNEITAKTRTAVRQQCMVLLAANDYSSIAEEECASIEAKGFGKVNPKQLQRLKSQISALKEHRKEELHKFATMADWEMYHDKIQLPKIDWREEPERLAA